MTDKKTLTFIETLKRGFTKAGVSASTQKSYISILKNVRKSMNYKGTSLHFCKDCDKITEAIVSKSISYKISTYSAIVKLTTDKKLKEKYSKMVKTLNKEKIEVAEGGFYTDKEKKTIGDITFTDLENIIPVIKSELEDMNEEEKPKQYYITYQYYILSLLYLKCEFLPRLDYCSVKVIYDKELLNETDNQLLVEEDKMTIYFRSYKNSKKTNMGEKVFEICEDIREEISDWLFYKTNIDKDYLFYNLNKSKPYNNKRFCDLLKRMFLKFLKTPLGCNHIRKLKEKHLQHSKEYINMSFGEKRKEHNKMFHSTETAMLHYNKKMPEDVEEI